MSDTIKRMHEYLNKGDYVVGSYNSLGQVVKPGALMGEADELKDFQHTVLNSASRAKGAEPIVPSFSSAKPAPKKKRAKVKKEISTEPPPLTPIVTLQQLEAEEEEREEAMLENTVSTNSARDIVESAQLKMKDITIHIEGFGKLKMKIEAVLESNLAYAFIFAREEDIIFTPQAGQTLNITLPDGEIIEVYYPDTTFTWIDNKKKIMLLFKQSTEEEQEENAN